MTTRRRLHLIAVAWGLLIACGAVRTHAAPVASPETSGVKLPVEVIHKEVDAIVYLDLTAASVDKVGASLDSLYEAIPKEEQTNRLRLLLDGLREQAKDRYEHFYRQMADAGVQGFALVIGGPEPGSHHGPHSIVLIRVQSGTEPDAVVQALAKSVPLMAPQQVMRMTKGSRTLNGRWLAFVPEGGLDAVEGDAKQAQEWNRQLSQVPHGALTDACAHRRANRRATLPARAHDGRRTRAVGRGSGVA